jgi:hypothetical protein
VARHEHHPPHQQEIAVMAALAPFRRLRDWLGRLVNRPADLLEVFSGCGTIGIVIVDLINYGRNRPVPSTVLLSDIMPEMFWLVVSGGFAALQLLALHLDDADDQRHPFLQPTKWLRMMAAGALLIWFLILVWAVGITVGLSRFQVLYGWAAGMNLYIVAHVLFRKRR